MKTPGEIVSELLSEYSIVDAMRVLDYAVRKVRQEKTLVAPSPQLHYMNLAYIELHSRNYGRHYYE